MINPLYFKYLLTTAGNFISFFKEQPKDQNSWRAAVIYILGGKVWRLND